LGLANFCSEFINHFATIAGPLTDMLHGETRNSQKKIVWNHNSLEAFEKLKQEIAEITVRSQPDLDKQFIITTDASEVAMGAVLSQLDENGREKIISCFSKKFVKAQQNYSTTDKEALAVEKGILHYDHYLRGKSFILKTDHQALQYIKTASNKNSRILRTALRLHEYNFTPIYIKGDSNIADILSRPLETKIINKIHATDLDHVQKNNILKHYHKISGHGTASNMKFLLKGKHYWKNIYEDIENMVEKCLICNLAGYSLKNTKNRVVVAKFPNQLWELDLIGRIQDKSKNNSYIFIAIDHYTKWIETRKIYDKSANTINLAIEELILKKHGIPSTILTDNGLEFNNEHSRTLAQKYNIKWEYSSPRHHETVGAVERANQTLMRILKKLSNFGKMEWEDLLESATFAYNISFNRAINTSPYILKYGKEPKIDHNQHAVEQEFARDELMRLRDRHFEKYKKSIIKGKKTIEYNIGVGERVLIYNPH
jgi:hypothetical protein